MKKLIEKFPMAFIPGIISGLLIVLFLTGKIIDYPRGTPQGGMIAAIGVMLIMVTVVAISYIFIRLKNHFKK